MMKSDYFIVIGIILMLGSHITTNYIVSIHTTITKNIEEGKKISLMLEANPISKYILGIENFKYIWSYVILPVMTFSIYYYYRKKYIEIDYGLLETIAVIFLGITLLDFLNDVSILLGYIK